MKIGLKDSNGKYNLSSQFLHWFMGLAIVSVFIGGLVMGEISDPALRPLFYAFHKGLGIIIMLLLTIRLAIRIYNHQKLPLKAYAKAKIILPKIGYWLMYLLMVLVPFSGWVFSSSRGAVDVFGLFSLPPIFVGNKPLMGFMYQIHEPASYALVILAVLHIAYTLKQRFIDKLPVLRRILPW